MRWWWCLKTHDTPWEVKQVEGFERGKRAVQLAKGIVPERLTEGKKKFEVLTFAVKTTVCNGAMVHSSFSALP